MANEGSHVKANSGFQAFTTQQKLINGGLLETDMRYQKLCSHYVPVWHTVFCVSCSCPPETLYQNSSLRLPH